MADRRHLPLALPQERRDPRRVGEQRVAAERRPDEGLVEPVALQADALPLLLADRARWFASRLRMNASYAARGTTCTSPIHARVLEAAELGAARDESPAGALNQVVFTLPGMASYFGPKSGTHHEWLTS